MPKIESLRKYPVAGMDGFDVQELEITPETIVGNRSFAVVLESEINAFIEDPNYIPLRMTQTLFPQLTLFKTEEKNGKLVIKYKDDEIAINQTIKVEEPTLPFYSEEDTFSDASQAIKQRALLFKVSKRSNSERWAEDCGDEVANWLSEKIGKKVRLVKAVKHPESPKHHFTWYTALHAVIQSSIEQLANDTGHEVDDLTFRYNAKLIDTDKPFDEETWEKVIINGVEGIVTLCERCKYIGIERATATVGYYSQVLKEVSKNHGMDFGIYIEPATDSSITLRVGDEIKVLKKTI